MVKTEAYTFPKHWPDKPACAGSSPAEATKCPVSLMVEQATDNR